MTRTHAPSSLKIFSILFLFSCFLCQHWHCLLSWRRALLSLKKELSAFFLLTVVSRFITLLLRTHHGYDSTRHILFFFSFSLSPHTWKFILPPSKRTHCIVENIFYSKRTRSLIPESLSCRLPRILRARQPWPVHLEREHVL